MDLTRRTCGNNACEAALVLHGKVIVEHTPFVALNCGSRSTLECGGYGGGDVSLEVGEDVGSGIVCYDGL